MGGARRQRERGGRGEGARVVGPSWAVSRGDESARGRGRGRKWARIGLAEERERVFLFLFIFSFPFLFYTNIHLCFLGAKMKY
jgi:hypothetical protein